MDYQDHVFFQSKTKKPFKSGKRSAVGPNCVWLLFFSSFPKVELEREGLFCTSYLKAGPWEEEMQSCGCRWPLLSLARRSAAGDRASSGRRECVWEWLAGICSFSPTLSLWRAGGGRAEDSAQTDANGANAVYSSLS